MNTTSKIAIGLGLAGGALLAAWLLTGNRKKRTKDFVVRRARDLKQAIKQEIETPEDQETYYYL